MFDAALTETLERRFGGQVPRRRPELYRVALDPEREAQRAWMVEALAGIPEPGRSRLTQVLRLPERFPTAYSELATLAILGDVGLPVLYEETIGQQKTPDLVVPGEPPVLLEVWTRRRSAASQKWDGAWGVLEDRLAGTPSGLVLNVVAPERPHLRPPTSRQVPEISDALHKWLLRPSTNVGASTSVAGYTFRVLVRNELGPRTLLVSPGLASGSDSTTIIRGVRDKARKYGPSAEALGAPYAVIVAGEVGSASDLDLLVAALQGKQTFSFTVDLFGPGGLMHTHDTRMNAHDVPEQFHPSVSAVGWLTSGQDQPGKLTFLQLPTSACPLPVWQSPRIEYRYA